MEKREPWPEAVKKFFHEAADTNPYATSATMRAYDQQLRNAVRAALSEAAAAWRAAAGDYAHSIPQPSRQNPFPPADQVQHLKVLTHAADRLSQLAADVSALEVPATDRVHHRVQNATLLLETVIDMDRALLLLMPALAACQDLSDLDQQLAVFQHQLQDRRQLLREIP